MPSIFARYIASTVGSIQSFFFDPEFRSKIITFEMLCFSYRENMSTMYEMFTSLVRSECPAQLIFDLITFIVVRE
jgi:hypothetical protein